MQSPSHRANILASDVDSLGVGMVIEMPRGRSASYVLTQIFATPFRQPSPGQMAAAVARLVADRRGLAGRAPLRRLPAIDEAAAHLARASADRGHLDEERFRSVHAELGRLGIKAAVINAEMLTVSSSERLPLSELVYDPDYTHCGIGVVARDGGDGPAVFTVVILFVRGQVEAVHP